MSQKSHQKSLIPYVLFGMFLLEILFIFVKKINAGFYGVFDALEKLYPIIAILILVFFTKPKINKAWWVAMILYCLYIAYGIFITFVKSKGIKIVAVQLYHELKFFPMMMLFSLIQVEEKWNRITSILLPPLVILTILLIAFQIVASGAYDAVFSNGGHFEKGHIAGMQIPRLVGWFWHPGQIALFFLIVTVYYLNEYRRSATTWIFPKVLLCFSFVFFAIQRFELFLLIVVLLVFFMHRYIRIDYRPYLSLILVVFLGGGVLYILSDQNNFWLILENFKSPRIVFLVESLFTVVESSYLGAGWGTIGSHAAADVAKVYEYNAMKDIWWVKLGQYFYDTYWPHVIGETGLPGFYLLLGSMAFMVVGLRDPRASMLMFVFIMTSTLSSNAQSLYHLTVFGWFIALIESRYRESTHYVTEEPRKEITNMRGCYHAQVR